MGAALLTDDMILISATAEPRASRPESGCANTLSVED